MDDQDASKTPHLVDEDRSELIGLRRFLRQGSSHLTRRIQGRAGALRERLTNGLIDLALNRDQIESIQEALVMISSWTMNRGFESDPNAELLFRFTDWLEKRHGRATVTSILLNTSLLRDATLIHALSEATRYLHPFGAEPPDDRWDRHMLESFKDRAGDRLLDLLISLASLEIENPPHDGSRLEKIAYFQADSIPIEFHRLAAMTTGEGLLQHSKPEGMLLRLLNRVRPIGESSALIPHIPGFNDAHLSFLVLSTTLFLQSYLVRNLIEALPELAAELGRAAREPQADASEIIDLKE